MEKLRNRKSANKSFQTGQSSSNIFLNIKNGGGRKLDFGLEIHIAIYR